MFTNAKTVMIGEKEVQSIVTSNGGVLYQKPSGYVLVLTCDKDTLNVNETVTFTALLTNNGVPVANELVNFCGIAANTPTSKSILADTETPVGCKYSFPTIPTLASGEVIYLDQDHKVYLYRYDDGGTALTVKNISGTGGQGTASLSSLIVEYGIIKWSVPGYSSTIDCTNRDLSAILSDIPVTIDEYGLYGTTDSNGEFSVTYTPTSTGNKTITANVMGLSETVQIQVT